jgi:hypothetical protein
MGLMENSSGCGREESSTSGEEWADLKRSVRASLQHRLTQTKRAITMIMPTAEKLFCGSIKPAKTAA